MACLYGWFDGTMRGVLDAPSARCFARTELRGSDRALLRNGASRSGLTCCFCECQRSENLRVKDKRAGRKQAGEDAPGDGFYTPTLIQCHRHEGQQIPNEQNSMSHANPAHGERLIGEIFQGHRYAHEDEKGYAFKQADEAKTGKGG